MSPEQLSESVEAQRAATAAPVCVLGMHRSGTSLLASIVEAAGVDMGAQQLEPGPDNPRGYFEDKDFVSFHEGCLSRRGLDYASVAEADLTWTHEEEETAKGLLETRRGAEPFGWKDPRTCLFADQWASLDPTIRFAVVFRHPMAVLGSLIRRGEVSAITDATSGLALWREHVRPALELLSGAGDRCVAIEADALFSKPDECAAALGRLGIDIDAEQIESIADRGSFGDAEQAAALEPLLAAVAPEVAELWEKLRQRAAVLTPMPARPDQKTASLAMELAGTLPAGNEGATRRVRHLALLTALSATDPRVASAVDQSSLERRLRDQLEAARENNARAESAAAASRENYDRVVAAEESSKRNYERALAAEASVQAQGQLAEAESRRAKELESLTKTLEERAENLESEAQTARAGMAEAKARLAELESAVANLRSEQASATARAASLRRELEEAERAAAEERERADCLTLATENADRVIAELRGAFNHVEQERNRYRRMYPPFAAKRVIQKTRDKLRARLYQMRNAAAVKRFAVNSRMVVLLTGVPEDKDAFAEALRRQTGAINRVVSPGELAIEPGVARIEIANWWTPDLPALLEGADFVLMMHPEDYGPGPLTDPLMLELAAAGLSAEPELDALVYRGQPGPPALFGQYNHVFETDVATAERLDEHRVAAVFRASAVRELFPLANHGESRSIREPVLEALRRRRRIGFAPRTFPLDAADATEYLAGIGAKLPATPKAPVKALFLTQWLECGGADKGAVDLLTRVSPDVADFSCMTTAAAANAWADRVTPHVRELVAMGDHLPLPDKPRFGDFLVEYVRRRDIGLIHIMHSLTACDALPKLKAELPGVMVVDQNHILEPPEIMEGGHPAYSSRHYKQYFDHRTVTSRWLERYLVNEHEIPKSDISVIYTCVDHAEEFNPARYEPGRFRERIGVEADTPLIVFLGRLHDQKRPELFARVAARVTQQRPDLGAVFALVGEGAKRGLVELERARMTDPSRLVLVGEVSRSQPVLRDADLMFMPSSHEGLAYVSYEAMSMGVPQLFTDVNGQSELITPETGVLLPVDPEELVDRATEEIIALLDDPARRGDMVAASRRRIVEGFGIDRLIASYESIYADLTAGRPVKRIEAWA